ncbi:CpsD/CapB family tyrosine-protein kinase [Mangrovicoccus sp. HB161399]|uniref:CpsD/CapB family tyrosine-protein kinase n=1 Tax=Mangrovicoccus sp. HB161399 TaxID=2720392 RepID=UPI00352F7B41
MFLSSEPPRSIVLSSSLPGEGKTHAALTLAHMNMIMGKRVVFVDCDFTHVRLSKAFCWTGSADLASVLRGDAQLKDAIISDPSVGFDVVPTLGQAAHISDLLPPGRFRAIVEELQKSYDQVVINAPPILSTADARVIARSADALIYLVRWDSTPTNSVRQGLALLAELGVTPLGTVMTGVDTKRLAEFREGSHSIPKKKAFAT